MVAWVDCILDRYSALRGRKVKEIYVPPAELRSVCSDDKVRKAASIMWSEKFDQLPVRDRKTEEWKGIVTDGAIMEKILFPPKSAMNRGESWLKEIGSKSLKSAEVVDEVPILLTDTTLDEAGKILTHHYAVLVKDQNAVGILTRNDFLRLLPDSKLV